MIQESILDCLGQDLMTLSEQGELEVIITRREEMRRLGQALMQKRKGNVLLVGETGVGRTSFVKGLAQRITSPKCAPALRGKRIIALSMPTLIAEMKNRGKFEEQFEAVLCKAETDPDIILFLDDLQAVLGEEYEGLNIVNLLKPALERGKNHLICVTTPQVYERYLIKDEVFTKRFELIWFDEPSREEALEILAGLKPGFEEHHGIMIMQEALEAAIDFSIRFIPDRRLPEKALDLIDQACAQFVLDTITVKSEDTEKATAAATDQQGNLGREEVARVISKCCDIPFEVLRKSEQERLEMLDPFLRLHIFGQNKAIQEVSNTLLAAHTDRKDQKRPIASLLFVGPAGVGKTATAMAIAEFLFGKSDTLISFDLSEYTRERQVSRLLGDLPEKIRSECLGMLTSALRQRPASVVIFDEIEKVHPDVFNVLLQILDTGELTDRQGCRASFREAVIIINTEKSSSVASLPEKPGFFQELIFRIGHVIRFEPLSRDVFVAIADKLLDDYQEHIQDKLEFPKDLRKRVLDQIDTLRFGAGELEQIVRSEVAAWLLRRNELVETDSGTIMFTTMQPVVGQQVALLIIDIVESAPLLINFGDTSFNTLIGKIYKRFKQHASASEMLFLKCTGDGFLSVFENIPAAFALAQNFLKTPVHQDVHVRFALHWGDVKTRPDGDVLGKEVHRLYRIEGVNIEHQIDPATYDEPLPMFDRIMVTKEGLERLEASDQNKFRPVGNFRLKGFDEPSELWVCS